MPWWCGVTPSLTRLSLSTFRRAQTLPSDALKRFLPSRSNASFRRAQLYVKGFFSYALERVRGKRLRQ